MWTEAEAKTKLCPFITNGKSIPDVITVLEPRHCVASECMAWRWKMTNKALTDEQYRRAGMALGLAYALQPTTYELGYCGAAGKESGRPPAVEESA